MTLILSPWHGRWRATPWDKRPALRDACSPAGCLAPKPIASGQSLGLGLVGFFVCKGRSIDLGAGNGQSGQTRDLRRLAPQGILSSACAKDRTPSEGKEPAKSPQVAIHTSQELLL